MARLTLFQTESLDEIYEIKTDIKKIKKILKVKEEKEHISAVVGELAGTAVNIIMSPEVQTALTIIGLIDLGDRAWNLIKNLNKTNKHFDFDKEFASALVVSKAIKKYKKMYSTEYSTFNPNKIKTIGIMEAEPESKKLNSICFKDFDDEGLGDSGIYFMGVVIKRPNKRSITFWFIIRNDGKICSSWTTQTYTKNLPKHLR